MVDQELSEFLFGGTSNGKFGFSAHGAGRFTHEITISLHIDAFEGLLKSNAASSLRVAKVPSTGTLCKGPDAT